MDPERRGGWGEPCLGPGFRSAAVTLEQGSASLASVSSFVNQIPRGCKKVMGSPFHVETAFWCLAPSRGLVTVSFSVAASFLL